MQELFNLPEPDLDQLTFCGPSEEDFTTWVASLPMANVGETSRLVFHALGEIVHLRTNPEHRFSLLEVSRSSMHYVGRSLEKHFVTQAVILEEKQLRIANLVQTMQTQLASGYLSVIMGLLKENPLAPGPEQDRQRQLLATAIHRAMSELGLTVLRSCQMYAGAHKLVWLKLHRLYALAEEQKLLDVNCLDPENRYKARTTIADGYKRLLLLGCCKPNQLLQKELAEVYYALEHWVDQTEIHHTPVSQDLFSFNLDEDRLVSYSKLSEAEGVDENWRGLCTEALVKSLRLRIEELAEDGSLSKSKDRVEVPEKITLHILNHLAHSWGAFFERGDGRQSINSELSVCIGLTAVQYFVSGLLDFNLQMSGGTLLSAKSDNPFMDGARERAGDDAWGSAFDAGGGGFGDINLQRLEDVLGIGAGAGNGRAGPRLHRKKATTWEELADETPLQPLFRLHLVDTSPGGRCISWGAQPSDRVQDGQILAFRDADTDPWTIAVVRWIQHRDNELRTGVEILSQHALACGVGLILRDRPAADFMRALEVPAMDALDQRATLLIPNVPFKEGQKIYINRRGKREKAILERCLFSTGSFARFEYRSLELQAPNAEDKAKESAKNKKDEDDGTFDNLWDKL